MIEMIGKPGSDVYVVTNIFQKDEMANILNLFLESRELADEAQNVSGQFKTVQINDKNIQLAIMIVSKMEDSLASVFGETFKPIILPDTRTSVKVQETGQRHPIHSDSSKTSHSGGLYGEMLQYSGILSLSDDYEGGEIRFPGEKVFIRLEAGSAIFFPSQKHMHQVELVSAGNRYTFLTFWESRE